MKTKKRVFDISAIAALINIRVNTDNYRDKFFDVEEQFSWAAKTEKEYKALQREIDNIGTRGKGWEVYAWYDVSSFEYWMIKQEEPNYIQITIKFDKDTALLSELPKIEQALNDAILKADAIQIRCNSFVSELIQKSF